MADEKGNPDNKSALDDVVVVLENIIAPKLAGGKEKFEEAVKDRKRHAEHLLS